MPALGFHDWYCDSKDATQSPKYANCSSVTGMKLLGKFGMRAAFADAVAAGSGAPVDENELIQTSLATLAVVDSLREGRKIDL